MRALHEVSGDELLWVKLKGLRPQFELHAGETIVATLAWTKGSRAVGQWAGGQYHFSRDGWLRPRVLVWSASGSDSGAASGVASQPEREEPMATFTYRNGTLTFPDGRTSTWKKPKRWTNERIWVDSIAAELARFHPAGWRSPVAVTIQPAAAALPELPLLLLLGEYLIVTAARDAEAATTAATVAVIASS
jgi:hypothetical protein